MVRKTGWLQTGTAVLMALLVAIASPIMTRANESSEEQTWFVSGSDDTKDSTGRHNEAAPIFTNESYDSYLAPYKTRFESGERQSLGIIGYFLGISQNRAAGIIAKGIADGYLSLEEKGSGAAIENVIQSLTIIETCNQLRSIEGCTQLMVDPEMMAIAIVQTSASRAKMLDQNSPHSQLYDVKENLSWGFDPLSPMNSGNNPFDDWYTKEKQVAETAGSQSMSKAIHYLHIVDPTFVITGAAVVRTEDADHNLASGQIFSNRVSSSVFLPEELRIALERFENTGNTLSPGQIFTNTETKSDRKMYRMYNPNSGEHFYTANAAERNSLVSVGWKYEGVGWIAPATSKTPVYRLYNKMAGDHHYTTDLDERMNLIKIGWIDEGEGWYSADSQAVPVYRQYNPNAKAGSHNFTPDEKEHNALGEMGWKLEGTAWYALYTEKSILPIAQD